MCSICSRDQNNRPSNLVFSSARLGVPSLEKKSSSDPELGARATIIGNERGFPAGFTVDELCQYRRRRPPSNLRPKDNLHPEDGSLKSIKSEYRRRFLPHPNISADRGNYSGEDHLAELLGTSEGSLVTVVKTGRDEEHQVLVKKGRRRTRPEDGLKLEGEVYLRPEYYDTFVDYPRQRPQVTRPRTHISENYRELPMDLLTEKNAQYVFFDAAVRPKLSRRPTTLRTEGDMLVKESEIHSSYVPHEGAKRPDLARRKTSLRMEGELDTITEQKEKYVGFPEGRRAELCKRATQLNVEGEMDTLTEMNEKYIYFPSPNRSELKRTPTNLKLEGEIEKVTENAGNFIEFLEGKRAEMLKRPNNLSLEGKLECAPEYKDMFIDFPRERPVIRRPPVSLKQEGELYITTEKRSQFIDFLSRTMRPDLARKPTNLALEGKMESKPEYRDSYVDFPRHRPKAKKPDTSLKSEGDAEKIIEKAQFVPISSTDRSATVKKPQGSLRLEGKIDTNPEYKDSFTNFPRERPVVRKPTGNLQHDSNTLLLLADEPFKRSKGQGRQREYNLLSEGRIDTNPEYRSSIVDLSRERPVARRSKGQFKSQNGNFRVSDSHTPRAQSERRYTRVPDVEMETKRVYVDYTTRNWTPSRRRPVDNLKVQGTSSLVEAISSPRVSRRLGVSAKVFPTATHDSGIYNTVSKVESRTRGKTVTFEYGDIRPRTCP